MIRGLDVLRKVLLSVAAAGLVLGLSREVLPRLSLSAPGTLPGEATADPAAGRAASPSPFLFDGIPMAMEVLDAVPCDLDTWTPETSTLWTERSLLLHLERSASDVSASWMDMAPGNGTFHGGTFHGGTFHGTRLTCDGSGRGRLAHTYTTAPLDPEGFPQRRTEPVTERRGPVPLIDGAVQLTALRNLDWTLYLDEPRDPHTALERLEAALVERGWSPKTPTDEHYRHLNAPVPDVEGGLWTRGNALCLAGRMDSESRPLLIIACQGNLYERGGAP